MFCNPHIDIEFSSCDSSLRAFTMGITAFEPEALEFLHAFDVAPQELRLT